jgi:hypothetical protein
MRFQVLTAVSMKFRVFWDVAPCSHVEVDWHYRGAYCLHHQGNDSLKYWSTSTRLQDATSHKTKLYISVSLHVTIECRNGSPSLSKQSRSWDESWTHLFFCLLDSSFGTQCALTLLKFNTSWMIVQRYRHLFPQFRPIHRLMQPLSWISPPICSAFACFIDVLGCHACGTF